MFGRYEYPLAIDEDGLKLGVESRDGLFIYYRQMAKGEKVERILASGPDTAKIVIHPVEPISVPKRLSLFLEIGFDPIIIGPNSKKTIYLRFPIEIGVFLESGLVTEVLDIFSFVPSKFSLYGTPKNGVITKWHRSRVYADPPAPDKREEGILRLEIDNTTGDFAKVSRTVLEARGMAAFFDWEKVAMNALMTIHSAMVAETSFIESPYQEGREKGIEILEAQKIHTPGGRKIIKLSGVEVNAFLMEAGYS